MQKNENQYSSGTSTQKIKSMKPLLAWEELTKNKNSFLIDVRAEIELERDGVPDLSSINKNVIHIPLNLDSNEPFVEFKKNLLSVVDKSDTILFLCRSGNRSHYCTEFCSCEFAFAYNILGGFCSDEIFDWINSGLPWGLPNKKLNKQ